MGKVKFGAIVTDIRGSIDGVTFSKSGQGATVRVKVSPVQPRSTLQVAARAIFARLSTAFSNTLTDSQRSAWKLFASNNPIVDVFGNSKTLTALAAYQAINGVLIHAGVSRIDDPPANMDVTTLTSATMEGEQEGPNLNIAFAATPLPAGHKLYIFATAPLPGGVSFINNRLKFIGTSAAEQTSLFNAAPIFTTRYGSILTGQKIGILVAAVNTITGAVSVGLQQIITIAATLYTWTERQPAGDVDKTWEGVALDSDGSNLIAGVYGGRLYTSADFGVIWTERQPAGNADKNWAAVASDSDGSNLIAGVYGGRLYTSADSGVSWTERQPAGVFDKNWEGAASNSDGSNLIASAYGGRLYTSADSGVSWTERQPAGNFDKNWAELASDSDGSHLVACVEGGRLYTSADFGVTWTERQPAGNVDKNWWSVASDSDGSHLIVSGWPGRLYTSADFGVTWTERQPAGDVDKDWGVIALNSDGSFLMVGVNGGRLYTSADSGVSWTERQPAGNFDKDWRSGGSSLTGTNLFVAVKNGRLYTCP